MSEIPLDGGDAALHETALVGGDVNVGENVVVRVGDTVRRPVGPHTAYAHALLRHFERVGFDGAPRVLGLDEQGREVLSYVEGIGGPRAAARETTCSRRWADSSADARRPGGLRAAARLARGAARPATRRRPPGTTSSATTTSSRRT